MEVHFNAAQIEKLIRKIKDKTFLQKPMRDFFDRAGIGFANYAKINAPVDTGRLRASLGKGTPEGIWEMDTSNVPLWLKVGTNVNSRGFSYPFALNESDKFHYRGGRPDLKGTPTKGWFTKAIDKIKADSSKLLDRLSKDIHDAWERNG